MFFFIKLPYNVASVAQTDGVVLIFILIFVLLFMRIAVFADTLTGVSATPSFTTRPTGL